MLNMYKYCPQARAILGTLLKKYQDEGVVTGLNDPRILQIAPFDVIGTRSDFERAVHELQTALYEEAA